MPPLSSEEPLPPDITRKTIQFLASKKPANYGASSNAPYYSKLYADEIKKAIDQMRNDKQDIWWRYKIWCTEGTGISEQTLYNRVNQSLRFLLERMDEDGIYQQWREQISVKREPNIGVHIFYKPGFGNNTFVALTPDHVPPSETKPIWYRKMLEWIEGESDEEYFSKENLVLSDQEQQDIHVLLLPFKNIYRWTIDQTSVKIIKV